MSCDYDYDDVWDPVINVVVEQKLVNISIDAISQNDLILIENTATAALKQKLCKLNIVTKNMDIYHYDNTLLINDQYNICKDLVEIATALGLSIKKLECELKGSSYILGDDLVDLISTINKGYSLESFSNTKLNSIAKSILEEYVIPHSINLTLAEMLRKIRETGSLTTPGTQNITTTYIDGQLQSQVVGDILSNKESITSVLHDYLDSVGKKLEKTNEYLRDGTVKLLSNRAKQMGYSVKEERVGQQVQIVLVRY